MHSMTVGVETGHGFPETTMHATDAKQQPKGRSIEVSALHNTTNEKPFADADIQCAQVGSSRQHARYKNGLLLQSRPPIGMG